MEEAFPRLP